MNEILLQICDYSHNTDIKLQLFLLRFCGLNCQFIQKTGFLLLIEILPIFLAIQSCLIVLYYYRYILIYY